MPNDEAVATQKREYVRLLLRNSITDSRVILQACDHVCSQLRWYQLPDDFVAVCKDIASRRKGLPTLDDAYLQAVGLNTDKHPAVVFTLRRVPELAHRIRRLPETEGKPLWARHWSATVDYVLAGGELPEPENQIEHRHVKASRETGDRAIGNLREMFAR